MCSSFRNLPFLAYASEEHSCNQNFEKSLFTSKLNLLRDKEHADKLILYIMLGVTVLSLFVSEDNFYLNDFIRYDSAEDHADCIN